MLDRSAEVRPIHNDPRLPSVETRPDGVTHFHYPQQPQTVTYNGREVVRYVPAHYTRWMIETLSLRVNLHAADNIIVPQKGGEGILRKIAAIQDFDPSHPKIRRVLAKRENGGEHVRIYNPEVLYGISPEAINVGIEDLLDGGKTIEECRNLVPNLHFYAPYAKWELHLPLPDHVTVIATIDKKWVGGLDCDFGDVAVAQFGYEPDYPRESWDLFVMQESLSPENTIR